MSENIFDIAKENKKIKVMRKSSIFFWTFSAFPIYQPIKQFLNYLRKR